MNSPDFNNPIKISERADILDILRGFALLGIGLANYGTISLYFFQSPETRSSIPTYDIDQWLIYANTALINGKFYTLFSLLFGIGFSIVFTRNESRGGNGLGVFYRRLFILAIFGLIHTFLIWDGDILFFYAVVGAFLPLFRNISDKSIFCLVIALVLSPLIFDVLKVISEGKWNISTPFFLQIQKLDHKFGIAQAESFWLLQNTSYQDLVNWNTSGFWWGWYLRMDSNRIPKVLAMFLLGLWLGRSNFYLHLEARKSVLQKVQLWGFILGLPTGLGMIYFEMDQKYLPEVAGLWDTLMYALNVVPLSLAYAATLSLWYLKSQIKDKLLWLSPMGRMALTNYILQGTIGILLFYGIGFGWAKIAGPSFYMSVMLVVFIFQMASSYFWLKFFNYGPLEWIWRQLTYGKRLRLRKM